MEDNVSDALKMAAAVLMFVVALTISISSFSNARRTVQTVIELRDREYDYTYVGDASSTKRIVGSETILPTVYRAYVENYKIFFVDNNNNPIALYQDTKGTDNANDDVDINYIDLEKENLGNDEIKFNFIKAILYGSETLTNEQKSFFKNNQKKFFTKDDNNGKIILCKILMGNKSFEESLGEYYQDDLSEQPINPGGGDSNTDDVPENNKTKKRVITYKLIN